MNAVWFLREQGVYVEASSMVSKYGRLYMIVDPEDPVPPMWMSTKAICDLAEMAGAADFKRK